MYDLALFLIRVYLLACFYVIVVFMLVAFMWTIVTGVISLVEEAWRS